MDPTRVYPIVGLLALVTVEWGGWSLLGALTKRERLTPFREQFFRAGHAHAGVLQVLSLVYYLYLAQTELSDAARWAAGALLILGILAQSGGFFVHMAVGQEGRSSAGTIVTRTGGVAIAAALIWLAVGLWTAPS